MRAGRGDESALRDQLLAQREDAGVAGGRAGLDHNQRVARLGPHRLRQLTLIGLAEFADDVAGDDEIGLRDLGEVAAGTARQIAALRKSRAVARQVEREPAERGVGIEQGEVMQ